MGNNFKINRIGFGGAAVSGEGGGYGFGHISEQDSITLIREAYDYGIRVFDTAPVYGFGLSEQRIGKALKSVRDNVTMVNKGGVTWGDNKRIDISNEPSVISSMLDQSLRDLGCDYIDIYMIHWPDPRIDIRQSMEVLRTAQIQGKIKQIGLCNTTPDDYGKAIEVAPVTVLQSQFNVFTREVKDTVFPLVERDKLHFMGYGTLDKGILTGGVSAERKFDPVDCRSRAAWWKKADRSDKYAFMEKLLPELNALGYSPLEFALGYALNQREVQTALCGARNLDQLYGLSRALEHLPGDDVVKAVLNVLNVL